MGYGATGQKINSQYSIQNIQCPTSKYCKIMKEREMKTSSLIFAIVVILVLQMQSSVAEPNQQDIKGYVLDKMSGEALPYTNVTVKGMQMGTTSNTEGYFIFVNPFLVIL